MPDSPHHSRGVTLMLVSVVCFTANVLLVRALGDLHTNMWLISCARFVVGLAMIFLVYRKQCEPAHLWQRRNLVERGVVGGLGVYLLYLTVVKIGAGRATFIGNTYVIWAPILAAAMLRERLRRSLILGGVIALVGLGLLVNVLSSQRPPGLYDLVAVGSAFISAYVVVTIRQLHATEHTSTIFAAQCVYGLLLCGVPAIHAYTPISGGAWGLMLLASICAGAGQLTMTRGFRELSVAEGSLLQMLVPIGIALGGIAFFGEHFSLRESIGAALILVATAFTFLRR